MRDLRPAQQGQRLGQVEIAARGLVEEGVKTFVEVGPGNVLSGLVKRIDRTVKAVSVNDMAGLQKVEETVSAA